MIRSYGCELDGIMTKIQSLKNEKRLKEENWIRHCAICEAGSYFQVCFYKVFKTATQLEVEESGKIILDSDDHEIAVLINTLKTTIVKTLSGENLGGERKKELQKWNKRYLSALTDVELLYEKNAQKAMIELIKMGGINDLSIPHLLRDEGITTNASVEVLKLIHKRCRGLYLSDGGFPPSCLIKVYLEKHKIR